MFYHTPLPQYTTPFRELIRRSPPRLHCISHPLVGPVALLTTFATPLLPTAASAHTTPPLHKAAFQSAAHLRSMTIEDGTHSGSRNVVGKLILHTVQKPQNRESVFIPRWKSKINTIVVYVAKRPGTSTLSIAAAESIFHKNVPRVVWPELVHHYQQP
jgi:hypothetical protein